MKMIRKSCNDMFSLFFNKKTNKDNIIVQVDEKLFCEFVKFSSMWIKLLIYQQEGKR